MDNIISTLHSYLFMGTGTLFLFQSAILFIHSRTHKVRQTLAIIELFWGLGFMLPLLFLSDFHDDFSLLRAKVLIIGSFFITLTQLFPLQVLRPGWLSLKKCILLFLPNILMATIFFSGLVFTGETIEDFSTYAELFSSAGHFNVWFRFIILFAILIYLSWILIWLYRYKKRYIEWKDENFSDQEYIDISWMRFYYYIIIGISVFYLGVLFIEGRIPIICHSLFSITGFSYLYYKILYYENPYAEDLCEMDAQELARESGPQEDARQMMDATGPDEDDSFEKKIPGYTDILKAWMEKEKPYLFHDFKLTDLTRVLPLNRSYLSRVINEGFGQSFSEVVRMYRVDYAQALLKSDPSLPIYKVAEKSGFRSNTTFIKAFRQLKNITPNQYREEYMKN